MARQLFILRHGEAESFASTDAERHLTERGRTQTTAILQQSLPELRQVTRIVASPYVRAQQTAELAANLLQLPVLTDARLTPDSDRATVAELWSESPEHDVLLLVSHQPLVGGLLDWLCGLPRGQQVMGTSALASLRTDVVAGGCGDLLWLRQP